MKKPKSCNGCRAHYQSQWKHECELGYEMGSKKIGSVQGAEIRRYFPAGGTCPKPTTLKELIEAPKAWEGGAV
jgi:hypothetical protein